MNDKATTDTENKGKLLVVIADTNECGLLCKYFEGRGYAVTAIDDRDAIVSTALHEKPDLIMLDVAIPGVDIFGPVQRLRSNPETADIPYMLIDKLSPVGIDEASLSNNDTLSDDDFQAMRQRVVNGIQARQPFYKANHISRLSAQILLESHMQALERQGVSWQALHLEIKHFQSFAALYGKQSANTLLRHTATLLAEVLEALDTPHDFVTYAGENRFVMLVTTGDMSALIDVLKMSFVAMVRAHYTLRDAERGYMLDGETRVPLLSLAARVSPHDAVRK